MTEEDRCPSPYLEQVEDNRMQCITSREKIHRIRCLVGYHAEVLQVCSPNEIWIRFPNHITAELTISLRFPPKLEKQLSPKVYVMVPLCEKVPEFQEFANELIRARIIKVDQTAKRALVRLIDFGVLQWNSFDEIYEMQSNKDELRTYPWQAICVSLHDVHPANGDYWSKEEIEVIQDVFSEFKFVWVVPQFSQHEANDDSEPIKVFMNGLSEEDLETINTTQRHEYNDLGLGITELFRLKLSSPVPSSNRTVDTSEYYGYNTYEDFES